MKDKIIEKFIGYNIEPVKKLTHTGILNLNRQKDKEWGMITVSNSLRKERSEVHLIVPSFWSTPPYVAHISAFTREETVKIPENFEYNGKEFTFKLSDTLRIIDPEGWDEVYECAIEPVECYELQKLRMSLGFTPLMYNNHEFHLTLGIKYIKNENNSRSR